MSQAKDAPDEPCGDGPARASKKSYAKPDHNQLKIDLRRHLNVCPQPGCNDRPQHSMRCHSIPDALPHGMPDERNRAGFFGFSICQASGECRSGGKADFAPPGVFLLARAESLVVRY